MATPSPTVRRKRLTTELRRLREQAGLTCEDVGQRLECSGTRISRIETGRIGARPGDVRELLEIYGVTGAGADALVQLARDARRKGWWHAYGPALPPWFEAYVGLEADAVRLRDFQPMVVPGLLQTADYARAVLRGAPQAGRGTDIGRLVALRMQRQAILDQASPPQAQVVLGESVLRALVGGPAVMRAQLRRLAGLAGQAEPHDPGAAAAHRGARPAGHPVHDAGVRGPRRRHGGVRRAPHRQHLRGGCGRGPAVPGGVRSPVCRGPWPRPVGRPDRAGSGRTGLTDRRYTHQGPELKVQSRTVELSYSCPLVYCVARTFAWLYMNGPLPA